MERVKRYAFAGEVIEVPLRWDEHRKQYVEDYRDYCARPGRTPGGRPVLLTIEDACPHADMADDDPAGIDCGACRHYHQFHGSLLGVCGNEQKRSAGTPEGTGAGAKKEDGTAPDGTDGTKKTPGRKK